MSQYTVVDNKVIDKDRNVAIIYSRIPGQYWVNNSTLPLINNKHKMYCPELILHFLEYGSFNKLYIEDSDGFKFYTKEAKQILKKLKIKHLINDLKLEWIPPNRVFRIGLK